MSFDYQKWDRDKVIPMRVQFWIQFASLILAVIGIIAGIAVIIWTLT